MTSRAGVARAGVERRRTRHASRDPNARALRGDGAIAAVSAGGARWKRGCGRGFAKKMIFIARAGTTRVLTSRRAFPPPTQVLAQDIDLLNPPAELEASKHKLKRLVQAPNSFFMDVKCQVSLVFSLCARSARALSRRRVDDASNASTDRSPSFIVVHPSILRVASTSPRFSLTRKPSCSAARARLCCASRPVVRLDSPRVAASVARAIKL